MNFLSIPIYLNSIYTSSPLPPYCLPAYLARNNLRLPRRYLRHHSVIRLIRAPRLSGVHAVLAQLPWALHRLQDLVLGRWLVDRVGDPGVPSGLDLGTIWGRLLVGDSGNGGRLRRGRGRGQGGRRRTDPIRIACSRPSGCGGGALPPCSRRICCRSCRCRLAFRPWCHRCAVVNC